METYLTHSSIALAIFYLIYRLVSIAEGNQQIRRFLGVSILIFCSAIPLIPPIQFGPTATIPTVFDNAIQGVSTIQSGLTYDSSESLSLWLILYFAGVVFFSFRFFGGLGKLIRLIITSNTSQKWGFTLVESRIETSPFSFFGYLFIQEKDIEKPGLEPIILHEQFHKNQLHTLDTILLELLTILFWFNPFMWLFQKEIKDTHEYMADDHVIKQGFDKLTYQDLLFKARTGISFKSASYLSNQTSLKQRFNMMEKSKTHTKASYFRIGTVIIFMALAVFVFSFPALTQKLSSSSINIGIYTNEAQVDLEEGINKSVDRLYVRIIPEENSSLAYRIRQTETTLVVGGLGRVSIKSAELIRLGDLLSKADNDSYLRIAVSEYQTQNKEKQVQTIILEDPLIFEVPIK